MRALKCMSPVLFFISKGGASTTPTLHASRALWFARASIPCWPWLAACLWLRFQWSLLLPKTLPDCNWSLWQEPQWPSASSSGGTHLVSWRLLCPSVGLSTVGHYPEFFDSFIGLCHAMIPAFSQCCFCLGLSISCFSEKLPGFFQWKMGFKDHKLGTGDAFSSCACS